MLVTGGGGIGHATAVGLARMGANVALTGREAARSEHAADEIRAATGVRVDVFLADLSVQAEVRRVADEVLEGLPRIDVLVNNVGGYWNTRHLTVDTLERTFAVNHLALFLLTALLLPRLQLITAAGAGSAAAIALNADLVDDDVRTAVRDLSHGLTRSPSTHTQAHHHTQEPA